MEPEAVFTWGVVAVVVTVVGLNLLGPVGCRLIGLPFFAFLLLAFLLICAPASLLAFLLGLPIAISTEKAPSIWRLAAAPFRLVAGWAERYAAAMGC